VSQLKIEPKSQEEKETDKFLDAKFKESVSNQIRDRNREKKLPAQDESKTRSSASSKISCDTKSVSNGNTQKQILPKPIQNDPNDGYHSDGHIELDKKQIVERGLIEELQCQDLSRVCTDRNDIGESQHISVEINEPCDERISKTLIPEFAPTLAHLFEKATKSCQKEILRWYNYSLEMESKVFAIMAESKATEQTVRAWIHKEMLRHLPGISLVSLRIKTCRAKKILSLFGEKGLGYIKLSKYYIVQEISLALLMLKYKTL
jgi:hypothetical protein